ncbi:MAG: SLC5 family protein [Sedimentisphaeraceae bacterium JB056]
MEFSLSFLDVLILVVCPLLVIVVGLIASRNQEKTADGYFLASGKLPWYVIGAAFVSTSVSSEQIVGTVGATYEHGMAIANWEWFGLAYIPLILFFIPIYLKNHIRTIPEFFAKRYDSRCSYIYSLIMLVAYVFVFMVPVLYGGSLAFSKLTGWNFYFVLWLTVIVIGLYSVKGGLASVVWADALQCLMLVGGGVILFFVSLDKIPGGWAAMTEANPERFHLYRPPSDPIAPMLGLVFASFGVFLFYQAANQVMIQRVLGARSTWDGIMGIIFAGFINRLRPLVTAFLGLIVYHWVHEMNMAEPLENRDMAFPFALEHFAPSWGLRGVILAGFAAAVMSTIGALSNSTATIFSLDVYKKIINPGVSDRRIVTVGRIAAMTSLAIAALVCPVVENLGGIFLYFQKGVTFLATPFISILLLGIFWRRTNSQGAFFAVTVGTLIAMGLGFGGPVLGRNVEALSFLDMNWLYLGFISQVIIMVGIVVVSLLTPPPSEAQSGPYQWRMSLLTAYDDGTKRPWYKSLLLWFIALYGTIIVIYWCFW